ncbi:hypothetical protein LX99_00991 [Mucilaginibacter oryzae]|uniref:Uncharacterized protein n=1 Tax=Mucilaginibacter oryzae TaxID=468058 RepID=A0A316HK52_9SPHI|nr:hypothetical protein LX99_00991 [Mucilaginibacter oryzae]
MYILVFFLKYFAVKGSVDVKAKKGERKAPLFLPPGQSCFHYNKTYSRGCIFIPGQISVFVND